MRLAETGVKINIIFSKRRKHHLVVIVKVLDLPFR